MILRLLNETGQQITGTDFKHYEMLNKILNLFEDISSIKVTTSSDLESSDLNILAKKVLLLNCLKNSGEYYQSIKGK